PLLDAADRTATPGAPLRHAVAYDVVQCETINVSSLSRRLAGSRRVLVLHDDDWVRCHRIALHAPDPLRRITRDVSAHKYRVLQWRLAARMDECWFVSEVEMLRATQRLPDVA